MSAQPFPQQRGWLSSLVAQVSDYVFEEIEDEAPPEPIEIRARPVVAVVSAQRRSGASTVARLLAAELALRADGAALVWCPEPPGRGAPGARPAIRLATALRGAVPVRASGRLCLAGGPAEELVNAGRYLAPVVLDAPPNGKAAEVATLADRVLIVAGAGSEPPLLDAMGVILGEAAIKIANRITEPGEWEKRADVLIPDARIAARAAAIGTRALGPLGAAIGELADAMELEP